MDQQATMYIAVGGLAGLVVLVLVIALLVRSWSKKRVKAWHDTAAAHGLTGTGTWPLMEMRGSLDGISVGLRHRREINYDRTDASDDNRTKYDSWCDAYASIPGGLGDVQIAEEGLFAKLSKLVGATDIETGDARFDKRFTVKSAHPAATKARLGPAVRESLLGLEAALRGQITVAESEVRWKGSSASHDRAIEILKHLAATAHSFEE